MKAQLTLITLLTGLFCQAGDFSGTFPGDTAEPAGHLNRFMVVGDIHHSSPSDDLRESLLFEWALAAIQEEVDLILIPGDLMIRNAGTEEDEEAQLEDWQFILDSLAVHGIRFYACRGNNDGSDPESWNRLFSGAYAFPSNGPSGEENLTYALEFDNALFLVLDQYTNPHRVNLEWLKDRLENHANEYRFAVGHEAAFKVSMSNILDIYPEARDSFWTALSEGGVQAYFCGHDHYFDHALIADSDQDPDNDVHQVIVGTGGGFQFPGGEYDGENGIWSPERIFHSEEFGYVLVDMGSEGAEMRWKRRTGPHIFVEEGESYLFTSGNNPSADRVPQIEPFRTYPNPFSDRTGITYELNNDCQVRLRIVDLYGNEVAVQVDSWQKKGLHQCEWIPRKLAPGVYYISLQMGRQFSISKVVYLGTETGIHQF